MITYLIGWAVIGSGYAYLIWALDALLGGPKMRQRRRKIHERLYR